MESLKNMTPKEKRFLAKTSKDVKLLEKLADDSCEIRILVAKNIYTAAETLEKLAEDHSWHVRASVAENLNTPIEIVRTLAEDFDYDVRYAAQHVLAVREKI